MSWDQVPKPDGVGEIRPTEDGFEAAIAIPVDEDGYFGRECPSCEAPFKMRHDEYESLPDDLALTCPYCGHRDEHSEYLSSAQRERVLAAAQGLAEQWAHQQVDEMLSKTFSSNRGPSHSSGVVMSYTPGTPPPVRGLPEFMEEQIRRVVECSTCGNHHAVYSATAFCPVCGPRAAAEKVLEAIDAAREALALEDRLTTDEREALRAAGVFERFAVDAIESVVSLFEPFAREQFEQRATDAQQLTTGKGNIFQRLDDCATLFTDHAGLDLVEMAGEPRWRRLKRAFAQRHVLIHNGGIVDERFLEQVPDSPLQLHQRLVIRRADAETALQDLDEFVRALAAA